MKTAEEILDSKRSMDFLKGAKRLRVIACMEAFKDQRPRCEKCNSTNLFNSRTNNRVYCQNKECKHQSILDENREKTKMSNVLKTTKVVDLDISVRALNIINEHTTQFKSMSNLTVMDLYRVCLKNPIRSARNCGKRCEEEVNSIFRAAKLID